MSVSIQGSFHRSANLVRDFYGTDGVGNYIVTTKALEMIERMVELSVATNTFGRAWSITGPYGGGKSSFALFLSRLLRGDVEAAKRLSNIDPILSEKISDACGGIYCPVLVVGSREPLSLALLRGLADGASSFDASFARHPGKPTNKVKACRSELTKIIQEVHAITSPDIGDEIVVDLYQRTAAAVHAATNGGLLLIVDELGKFLEYAAIYPDRTDLYVLQRLAERASWDINKPNITSPLLLFTISHQSFDRYAGRMSNSQRDEWRKVQGRFEDFAFVEPVSETLRLLESAVHVEDLSQLPKNSLNVVDQLLDIITHRPDVNRVDVQKNLEGALPLHPAVSLIVGPLFRRLAQNERSLFAFLASGEQNSFLDIVATQDSHNGKAPAKLPLYRLDHLYDYIVGSVGTALFGEHMGKLWSETEAALSRLKTPNELAARCIKQIAVLNFAGPLARLSPTIDVLYLTADATSQDVDKALVSLISDKLITYRPFKDEYHIWQGSDFDLDAALREARSQITVRTSLSKLLSEVLPPTPIVARRHSFQSGTTRVFDVLYASDESWLELYRNPHDHADGRIIYVLPDHEGERNDLLASVQKSANDSRTLVAIPEDISSLHELVRELMHLEWVRENAIELQGDEVARHEVDQQLADLSGNVEQRLTSLLVADPDGNNPCTWIYQGRQFYLQSERSLQDKLSHICDEVFHQAPQIWNELLNRHQPSPSAVKGLKLLLGAMLNHGSERRLGIQKYPVEYGMYAAILESTGIHRKSDTSPEHWYFSRPDSAKNHACDSVWDHVTSTLHVSKGERVSVQKLYDQLRLPPYGMRRGLMPILLWAVYKSAEDEIAIYENGTFVPKVDFETIERFLKRPEKFELQWVTIDGARAELLHRLAPLFGLSKSIQRPLPVVLRILERIHGLPPYVRRTASLSQNTLNVREVLHRAIEPATLLFEDLPEACGVSSFLTNNAVFKSEIQIFSDCLQGALRELMGAYDSLIRDLETQITNVFRLRSKTSDDRRHEFATRAHQLLTHASDTTLKAFLVRATDEILDTQSWYESLASLLVKRPPVQWTDEDVDQFRISLNKVARRFYTLEPIVFDIQQDDIESESAKTDLLPLKRIRLSVTMQYESENEQVISIHPEDRDLIDRVSKNLKGQIEREEVAIETKIAAVAQLSNELLNERETATKINE